MLNEIIAIYALLLTQLMSSFFTVRDFQKINYVIIILIKMLSFIFFGIFDSLEVP
jgi:hypothetical protein